MVALDTSFVVREEHIAPASRAAFLAWHQTLRPWRVYAACAAVASGLAFFMDDWVFLLLAPFGIAVDAWQRYRRILASVASEEPVGTTVALGFGEQSFAFKTWTEEREVPYSAVSRVSRFEGFVVIQALTHRVFWPLPEEVVPPDAIERMRVR